MEILEKLKAQKSLTGPTHLTNLIDESIDLLLKVIEEYQYNSITFLNLVIEKTRH